MCLLDGISITTPLTPVSIARCTSSFMQRQNEKICGPRLRRTISLIASLSDGDTIGMPASIRCTPASASASAMRIFSSLLRMMPVCCSPSRSDTSWILMPLKKLSSLRTSSA